MAEVELDAIALGHEMKNQQSEKQTSQTQHKAGFQWENCCAPFRHCYRVEFRGLAPMGFGFFYHGLCKPFGSRKCELWSQHGKYGCPQMQPMQVHRRRSGARNGSRTVAAAIRNCHPGFALHSRLSNTYLVEIAISMAKNPWQCVVSEAGLQWNSKCTIPV